MRTIAWDIDNVLNELMREWLRSTGLPTPYEAISEDPPHRVLGLSLEDYLASLDRFRLGPYSSLEPSQAALAWLERNGGGFDHVAITAVPNLAAHVSRVWVERHFGRYIREVHVVPSSRPNDPQPPVDKSRVLERFRDAVLIDDSPEQVRRARERGLAAILYGRPWNAGGDAFAELDGWVRAST